VTQYLLQPNRVRLLTAESNRRAFVLSTIFRSFDRYLAGRVVPICRPLSQDRVFVEYICLRKDRLRQVPPEIGTVTSEFGAARKVQTRAASRAAASKEIRNASGKEVRSTSSFVCRVLPAPNTPECFLLELDDVQFLGDLCCKNLFAAEGLKFSRRRRDSLSVLKILPSAQPSRLPAGKAL